MHLYEQAHKTFGTDVGANLVDDGTGTYEPYNLPNGLVAEKAAVLERWLHPPEVTPAETTAPASPGYVAESATGVTSGSGYAIPADIVACESGGDYGAVNPSSGATGAYQILPSTSAAYGCDLSTPAGQDACAAAIYADVGSSAWECAG